MIPNRSIPQSSVIPELAYADVGEAADWLCDTFGFRIRLRIGKRRVQLVFGDGAVVATERDQTTDGAPAAEVGTHSVLVRVDDVDRHHEHARASGARIHLPPTDYPYGERQYSAMDIGGHRWRFSQSIADVDPASWGATSIDID